MVDLADGGRLFFAMSEPEDHEHLDDVAHAKVHAEQMPTYVASGLRPS